jgi:hypothetical protein
VKKPDAADLIDVLVCDIGARPKNAPSFEDVAPYIRTVQRTDREIVIRFDNVAALSVEALVDAEQRCCADLIWTLEREPDLILTIGATPAQLDVLQQMLTTTS